MGSTSNPSHDGDGRVEEREERKASRAGGRGRHDLCGSVPEEGYGEDYDRYLASAYYNDFAAPGRAHDNLSAAVSPGPADLHSVAALQFWHQRPDGRRFGEREVNLLRLLFPAFRAGVESYLRWRQQRSVLLRTLDELDQAVIVCDSTGQAAPRLPPSARRAGRTRLRGYPAAGDPVAAAGRGAGRGDGDGGTEDEP